MIELLEGFTFFPEAQAILAMPSKVLFDEKELSPVNVGKFKVAPWGEDNDLPRNIVEKAEKNEVVSSNLLFNMQAAYGLGPKPMRRIVENSRIVGYEEIVEGAEADFFEDNDLQLYLLEQLNDMNYFFNTFPEIILSENRSSIVSLRSKEAAFSRWTSMSSKGVIEKHIYSTKWPDPREGEFTVSEVLDEYNPYTDLLLRAKSVKEPRFVYPIYMPSPGRPYYAYAPWWSIFGSGYYDHSVAIPELKNMILKNKLGIRYIIYISDEYFKDIFKKEGIDPNDRKATADRIALEKTNFSTFLTGSVGAGKSLMALKKTVASGNSSVEQKYIEIVEVKNDLKGGELVSDLEEVNNVVCYAMGVHPSLVGAVPGKTGGSMGGTDKRELFMIKQALMRPIVDRVLRPFKLIKRFNNWDKNMVVTVPDYVFTTLDKNKSGKNVEVDG